MKNQKIVLALSISPALNISLHDWGKNYDFSRTAMIYLIHVVKKNLTPFEYGIMENPDDETFEEMKPALNQYLLDESYKIIPENYEGIVETHILKSFDADEEVEKFLSLVDADLIVVTPTDKHGLEGIFHHSFTHHMIKSAPCDVYVVRTN